MRTLLIAILLGLTGSGLGYWQILDKYKEAKETFVDPKERIRQQLAAKGVEVPEVIPAGSAPKVEVIGGTTHNFGTMMFRSSRTHKFIFKNVGKAPLSLEVIYSSCKCTIGELEKSILQPDEQAGVELTWTAESMLSEFTQTATIRTNDPDQQEVKLSIVGHIGESIFVNPPTIIGGDVSSRETVKLKSRLFSLYDKPMEILSIGWKDTTTADRVKISHTCREIQKGEFPEHLDAKWVGEIEVELLPGLPTGPLDGSIGLKTNLGESTVLAIAVRANIISEIRIIAGPNYDDRINVMNLGKVSSTEGGVKKFMIGVRLTDGVTPEITPAVIKPDESIDVRVLPPTIRGSQAIFPIEVEIPKGAPAVSLIGATPTNFGKLAFRTNMEYAPEISVFLRLEVEDD